MDKAISDLGNSIGISHEDIGRADLMTPGDYESMVFSCDEKGNVLDWTEVDFDRYSDEDAAVEGHNQLVDKWSKHSN